MVIDRTNQYVYYAVGDGSATTLNDQIRRVGLNGTGDTQIAVGVVESPGALALDQMNNRLLVVNSVVSNTANPGRTKIVALNLSNGTTTTLATPANINGANSTQITGMVTVNQDPPTVSTGNSVSNITTNSANVGGTLTTDGGAALTDYGVVYVQGTGTPTTSNTKVQVGTSSPGSFPSNFVANLTGLIPGTQYTASAYATNSLGTRYGSTVTFTTTPNSPTITSPANNSRTNNTTINIMGTARANSLVRVYNSSNNTVIGTQQLSGGATSWSISISLAANTTTTVYATAQLANSLESAASSTVSVIQDSNAPTVTSVGVPANGNYSAGQSLSFTVNFAENVNVIGTPQLGLTIGATNRQANYTGGTGTSALTFSYTVQSGDLDTDGIALITLSLNSGTIRDAAGNNATLTLNNVGSTANVRVDAVAPTVSISSSGVANGATTSTSPLPFTLTFSESVTGLTSNEISVTNGTLSDFSGSGTTYFFNVTPTSGGQVTVNVVANVAQDVAGNGNSAASPYSFTYQAVPTITSFVATNPTICIGQVVGFTATLGNVGSGYTYTLSDGQNAISGNGTGANFSQSLTVNTSGTRSFTLAITSNGQTTQATTQVTVNTPPTNASLTGGTLSCAQPSLTITASADGASSYSFSQGANQIGSSNQGVVSQGGTYTVVISSAQGCTVAQTTTIASNTTATPVTLTVNGSLSCPNPSVTLTATAGFVSYAFSSGAAQIGGSAGNTASVTATGTYSVSATNADGCVSTTNVTVTGSTTATPVSLTVSGTLSCSVTSVTLTATTGFASYSFSSGAAQVGGSAGNTATVNTAGTYSVSAANANGCVSTTSVTVTGSTTATAAVLVASSALSCSATSVTLTATTGFTSYTFSAGASQVGGSTGNTATVNTAGTYSVSATNASGCVSTTNVTVVGSSTATPVDLTASGTLSCSATSVTLTATAGFTSYTFSSGAAQIGGSAGNTATVSTTGVYSVSATNANGCVSTTSVTVTGSTTDSPVSLTASGTLSCSNTTVTLTATAGFTSYVFSAGASQVGGSSGNTATVNAAGTYSVTATNASGCQSTTNVTVTGSTTSSPVTLTVSSALSCSATSVTLTATAGFASYTFSTGASQVGGSSGNTATVTTAGTYSVSAINASGCVSTTNVTVVGSTTATPVSLTASGPLSCSAPSVTLTATPGFTSYVFSAGAAQVGGSSGNTATVNTAGTYSVSATNANGCVSTTSVTVTGSTTASPVSLTASGTISCSNTTVTLTATPGFTSYIFSAGASQVGGSSGNTATVNTAGTYSVTAVNASGCQSTTSVLVTGGTQSSPVALSASGPLSCSTSTVTLTATPGFTSYVFSAGASQVGGSAGNTATVSTTGVYSVTATNSDGCSSVASTSVTFQDCPPAGSFTIVSVNILSCSPSGPNRRYFSFTPVYSGLNGQPISFSVVNQLPPTTQTGPYSLDLYTDNPVITLKATQQGTPGEATFSYNWLNACMGMTAPNTPPSVVAPIAPQSATVNQTFSYVINPGTFTDAETPSSLTYAVTGLPPGIGFFAPNFISGTPSTTVGSPFSVTVTATDPGGLSTFTTFALTVYPAATTATFGITGVNLVNCITVSPNRKTISFNPVYSGTTGQSISFSVVNELPATTAPGPYELTLYTDNPVITLKATQQNTPGEATYAYNWLAACNGTPSTNTPPTVANPIGPQSATVNQGYSFVIPANTFTDAETPGNLALSVSGLPAGLGFTPPATISGTPSTSAGSPFSVTVTATDPGGLSTFTVFTLTVNPQSTTPPSTFAITGATLVNCSSLTPNRRAITFNPVYSGLNGQPITFSVVNELAPTTNPGPYQLNLYTDNPVIVLKATQQGTPGEATFSYNWLDACNNVPSTNTPPTVANPIGPQSATINVSYNFTIPANTFTDAQTPGSLALSVSGLPVGLSFNPPATISGTPSVSMAAPYSVTVTATDPGGLSTFTTFNLTVNPNTSTTAFAITGATLLNCTSLSANRKSISFNPVYQGATGQPISFSVVNELAPTTNPGPYQLSLYTDNPVIVLKAVQAGTPGEATYSYNWLAACNAMARVGAPETWLEVVVLGNPVVGESVEVGVKGAAGSALRLRVVNAQGRPVHAQTIDRAGSDERVRMNVGQTSGIYLLDVSIPGQHQTIKLVKP
ncbi:hypothetical protein GCM10027592_17770 [Spirosoma flavus]